MENKRYGFIPSLIENDHYVLGDGSLNPPVLMTGGHGWIDYLPADDFQSNPSFESMNCTSYGTLHALATLGKKKFGIQFQTSLSERYTGIMTDTTPQGNDPHKVIELIRTTYGVVPEVFLPFGPGVVTWQEYYAPNPMTYALYAMGAHWLKKYQVSHQWVTLTNDSLSVRQQKMMEALQFSPLGVSVFAWSQHSDGLYYSDQPYLNHWVTLYDFNPGVSWSIFDSYDKSHKLLEWNFNFGQAKQYGLDYAPTAALTSNTPEQVVVPYIGYRLGTFINEILK